MKRSLRLYLIIILLMVCPGVTIGADFRDVEWGMSMDRVKSIETLKLKEQKDNCLVYALRLADLDTVLTYHFTEGMLTSAEYRIGEMRMNTTLYVSDFGKIQTLLRKKYGEPTTYQFVADESGACLSHGGLTIISLWNQPGTEITHVLTGSPLRTDHTIWYKSKKHRDIERKAEERKVLNNL
ncbi:MAG: hypothetical protein JW736_07570 [Deltaproteobacteria bacterium]|nr:hypothetical protein [Deltaproteobacteria bacterium]MBN2686939.1 hypothetical protein [Deltaproteobacteria bacterium]